jgi:hypothetical protein
MTDLESWVEKNLEMIEEAFDFIISTATRRKEYLINQTHKT